MRPPIGAGSHVQSQKRTEGGGGTMGLLMPMYTIGIVIFFGYTVMKVRMFRYYLSLLFFSF